jgi:hypothetical protein
MEPAANENTMTEKAKKRKSEERHPPQLPTHPRFSLTPLSVTAE